MLFAALRHSLRYAVPFAADASHIATPSVHPSIPPCVATQTAIGVIALRGPYYDSRSDFALCTGC